MDLRRATRSRLTRAFLTLLLGGTMFSTCQTRFKEAAVQGSEAVLFGSILNPQVVTEFLFPTDATTDEADVSP